MTDSADPRPESPVAPAESAPVGAAPVEPLPVEPPPNVVTPAPETASADATAEQPPAEGDGSGDTPATEPLVADDAAATAEPENPVLPADHEREPHVEDAPAREDRAAVDDHFGEFTAVVRHGFTKQVGLFRHNLQTPPRRGQKLVIRTERGVELGEVVTAVTDEPPAGRHDCLSCQRLKDHCKTLDAESALRYQGKILRVASSQDLNDQDHLDLSGSEKLIYARQQSREMRLPMKIVAVENLLGGERIIFYFTSESRVDFRELVRRMAAQYRTRIEMRQVGARDEARLVGDYERCGQRCCCQQFLKTLQPVSIRMAKTQKATLDPAKISGRCGRLMCCLRYEDEGYEDLRKRLPKKNTFVRTEEFVGKVIETHILTQLVKLLLVDGKIAVVENDAIVQRDMPVPPPQAPTEMRGRGPRDVRPPRSAPTPLRNQAAQGQEEPEADETLEPTAVEGGEGEEPAVTSGSEAPAGEAGAPPRKRRRRRRRGKGQGGQPGQPASDGQAPAGQALAGGNASPQRQPSPTGGSASAGQPSGQGNAEGAGGRKRRRRRRGRGRSGPGGQGAPPSPAGPSAE